MQNDHHLGNPASTAMKVYGNPLDNFELPCADASKYHRLIKIGEGSYGEVFKAIDFKNPEKYVAMKRLVRHNWNKELVSREIRILQHLKHENVVDLIEICKTVGSSPYDWSFYLVFEFCEHDLARLLYNRSIKFSLGQVKKLLQQLLNGLLHIHNNKIIHRDLKPGNILVTKYGIVKLADFGQSREFTTDANGKPNTFTPGLVTLFYRPPELLLGEHNYGYAVDLWSVGCIMAELWTRKPIMSGRSELEQLTLISNLCGSITPQRYPGVQLLEIYQKIKLPEGKRRKVKNLLKTYTKDQYAIDLLDRLLTLNPLKRIDANTAVNHELFRNNPMPCEFGKVLANLDDRMLVFRPPLIVRNRGK